MIRPFTAQISDAALADLQARIRHTRWPLALSDSGWTYGTNEPFLRELATHWSEAFDWRKVEAEVNAYPLDC